MSFNSTLVKVALESDYKEGIEVHFMPSASDQDGFRFLFPYESAIVPIPVNDKLTLMEIREKDKKTKKETSYQAEIDLRPLLKLDDKGRHQVNVQLYEIPSLNYKGHQVRVDIDFLKLQNVRNGTFELQLAEAKVIKDTDLIGKPDPYVEIKDKTRKKTYQS